MTVEIFDQIDFKAIEEHLSSLSIADNRPQAEKLHEFLIPSSSNPRKVYKVIIWDNGDVSCNCPGWIFKNRGTSSKRFCKHAQKIIDSFLCYISSNKGLKVTIEDAKIKLTKIMFLEIGN